MTSASALTRFSRDSFDERDLAGRGCRLAVCLPAREEAETVGAIVEELAGLRARGLIDQLVVIDAASGDGTAERAAAAGAEVHQRDELMTEHGPAAGKGDAIWRSQAVVDADVVCFFDADLRNFSAAWAVQLLAPLVRDRSLQLVKAAFERPLRIGEVVVEAGGGRVTELTARPLLQAFYPELALFSQPLSGQFAIRSSLLAELPLPAGYGVDIALLIGAWRRVGLGALCESAIGVLETNHQGLAELSAMASSVVETLLGELVRERRLDPAVVPPAVQAQRPPFASVRVSSGP